jgi:hypothetical protein
MPVLRAMCCLILFLALSPAQASAVDGPRNYSPDREFATLVFEAAGYLTEDFELGDRPGWRERALEEEGGGERISLALKFAGADPWPTALEFRQDDAGAAVSISDRYPFGGENLNGGDQASLNLGLARLTAGLDRKSVV